MECLTDLTEYITLKGIVDEDFVNYKVPSMTLMFPKCSFKCEKNGSKFCQNSSLVSQSNIKTTVKSIYRRYINNPISKSIVCQGLEPFDSWNELYSLLFHFKIHESCSDTFVIYTGYNKEEIMDKIEELQIMFENVVVKFGRFIPNNKKHFDETLGVYLASDNQYGEKIS